MNKLSLEILIKNEVKKVIEKCNNLFPEYKIEYSEIKFKFNLRGVVAGKANYKSRLLAFNLILAEENLINFFNDTIPHEIAHLYQRKIYPYSKPHGYEWKRIMLKMGYNPTRCHNYDTQTIKQNRKPKIKYIYSCKCNKKFELSELLHSRIKTGQIRYCKTCKGNVYFTNQTSIK